MKIIELKQSNNLQNNPKLNAAIDEFNRLTQILNERHLPDKTIELINQNIEALNATPFSDKTFKALLQKKQTQILKYLEKEHKLVTKNHYRNLWSALGIALGLPFGVAFATAINNMALIAIGLPIGIAIGFSMGTNMDNKAAAEGRQLDIEIKNRI